MPIGSSGPDIIVNTETNGDQGDPSVTALADGRFVVTWQSDDAGDGSGGCVRARVHNADGSAAGNDFIVDTTAANNQETPAITALADGRFVVTWRSLDPGDGSGACIRARVHNADGSPDATVNGGADFIVNSTATDSQYFPAITALADGRFVVAWTSYDTGDGSISCIRARAYNSDGGPDTAMNGGADFIVNSTTTDQQSGSAITALADGRFVVTWVSTDPGDGSGFCVRARLFNADGSAAANDFVVNTTAADDQYAVGTTALANGRFVVTWHSNDTGDGSLTCVRARVYNADGSAAGNDFIVDTTTAGHQFTPAMAALADGRFVVAWESGDGGDGAGSCIRARVYNADGSAAGADFIVNSPAALDQHDPAVTALADGRFVVTWQSDDGGDGSEGCIRSRIFDPSVFNGTSAGDLWRGGDFTDWISGGNNGDTLSGLGGDDFISGDAGNDLLSGGAGADRLFGGTGNDTLNGGTGVDALYGGVGDDLLYVDNASDHVIEAAGGGGDRVLSSVDYTLGAGQDIERLTTAFTGGTDAIDLTGNDLGQFIQGNQGINILDGKGGADTMQGFGGADFYYVDNGLDKVIEAVGGGHDRVLASVDYALGAGQDIERLTTAFTGGTDAINLTGNDLGQFIQGNQGSNILDGRGGADTLQGFGGNDFYYVDDAADQVIEAAGQGTDAVYASVDYTLAAAADVEALNTSFSAGTTAINLKGNDLAQTVRGNGGNNSVYGGGGNDTLIGGLGRDAMKGEAGNDSFDFNAAAETGINANTRDKIADFTHGQDIIDLSTIDANGALAGDAFNYIGVAGFSNAAGQLRYVKVDNVNDALDETIIEADIDGNGIADFQIALTGLTDLVVGDFVV